MDPPQEAIDETAENVNPLDRSASSLSDSTTNEYASIEALVKISQDMKAWSGRIPWYKYGRVQ